MNQFDPDFPGLIQGDITNVIVTDSTSVTDPVPNLVIDPTKDWFVKIEWVITGIQAPLYLAGANRFWDVSVYAESIGSSPEILLASAQKATTDVVNPAPADPKYQVTITIPAPSPLEEHVPGTAQSGIYKLAVAVFLDGAVPGPFDMIGFKEGPMIQVENPN
jgi:hypothetical protein